MSAGAGVSRSVGRALAVFDLHARERRALSPIEIRERLNIPQPSAHALLKDLVDQGWLAVDGITSTYLPTAAFARLGSWVGTGLLTSGAYVRYLDALALVTSDTISLATVSGELTDIVAVRAGTATPSIALGVGLAAPLLHSATGAALLALLRRPGGEAQHSAAVAKFAQAFALRRAGVAEGVMLSGVTIVAVALPSIDERPVVAVVAGFAEPMKPGLDALSTSMANLRDEIWSGQ